MKIFRFFIALVVICSSCAKEETTPSSRAIVNVVNTVVDLGPVKVNYFNTPISWSAYSTAVNFAATGAFNIPVNGDINIVSSVDTLKKVYTGTIGSSRGDIFSLFLTGKTNAIEHILIKETPLAFYADSVIGVRIINLSPNSPLINVTMASTPNINEIVNLAYGQKSEFKKYALRTVIPTGSVSFQIKDAVSNTLLTTYTLPVTAISPYTTVNIALARFRNITLVIKGLYGTTTGTNSFSVFPVASY